MNAFSSKVQKILRSRIFPWAILGIIFLICLAYLLYLPPFVRNSPRWSQILLGSTVILGLLLVFMVFNRVGDLYDQREKLQLKLLESEQQVRNAYQRIEAIFRVGQKLEDTTDETQVVNLLIKYAVDLVGIAGASFVPLDEHGQPMAASSYGDLPQTASELWLEYLATPAVRERCQACDKNALLAATCPFIGGPFSNSQSVYCLPLRHADREFGVLNLFLVDSRPLDSVMQAFIGALVDQAALAMERVRLRQRELAALRQMQLIRQKADLRVPLASLLESVHQTLECDASLLFVKQQVGNLNATKLSLGEIPEPLSRFVEGIILGVLESGKPITLGDVGGEISPKGRMYSFLAAPLLGPEREVLGAILIGSRLPQSFGQRQMSLLQTLAGQITLFIQNTNMAAEIEYQSMIEERKRLAREIHDGLAQTLGFLKLQAAQLSNFITRHDYEQAQIAVNLLYTTISDAYQDARQAIDDLRIGLGPQGLKSWLGESISELQELSGLSVTLRRVETNSNLAPEIHAQLMRIVQEALNNVRKHAHATHVWIDCFDKDGDMWLEIKDDGMGFSPEDVNGPSKHGLHGMRERADLIGADFQVISRPGEGTIVHIRLPNRSSHMQETLQ